ncbi:type VI secretion system protein TssA [Pseudoduganella buxea]|uniref:ImpA N-terminal domain-containing protein n=2 Tax=Pseudoduganella buxea TaxID=1949069 RepID=A0ABQ1KXL9_9BURK|nr:type VI secretion system protein TssA [Pseudoduganella buxea]GGC13531.1 hypothetical protein GCM10011572_38660 [Pseudoduganella buxea]
MTIATLLDPLEQGGPCGAPLLHEPEYDAIALARHEDDTSLPLGVWTGVQKRADWHEVVRLCEEALRRRSKDIQVAAWLGEAWISLDGLAGGLRATTLLHALCEAFWPALHPLPRDGDQDFRTAPFDWADQHWHEALLLRVPLVQGTGPEAQAITLGQWRAALAAENEGRKEKSGGRQDRPPRVDQLTHAQALAQAATMPVPACRAALEAATAWSAALTGLHVLLDRLLPGAPPRLRRLCETLAEAEQVLRLCLQQHPGYSDAVPEAPPVPAEAAPAVAALVAEPREGQAVAVPAGDIISGRADAYRRLAQVADYLAATEPHSPVPALLRRAVRWGALPFEALIAELTYNNNEIGQLLLRAPLDD